MSQQAEHMKHRLELFSDAVFAIIITVMLLELRIPETGGWSGWKPLLPGLLAYAVTFVFLLVVWLGHHHMFSRLRVISRGMYWANGFCLLLTSLIPLALHNFVSRPKDPTALVLYLALVFLAFQCLTVIRLLANAEHGNDPGWAAWRRKRNRVATLLSLLQLGIAATAFVSIPLAIGLYVALILAFIPTL